MSTAERQATLTAIPSRDSFYFTSGKRYPVRVHRDSYKESLGSVTCDKGHERIIGLDGGDSAHLWDPKEWHARGPGKHLGHFKIEEGT